MATNKELEAQIKDCNKRISALAVANSKLTDEIHVLKGNYNKLVGDVSSRLEAVAKKIFRE
tara:strand:+ start:1254 stop:1436 length:183 start_codon:yes stop_codon:yes gene_type:complete